MLEITLIIALLLAVVLVALLLVALTKTNSRHAGHTHEQALEGQLQLVKQDIAATLHQITELLTKQLRGIQDSTHTTLTNIAKNNRDELHTALQQFQQQLSKNITTLNETMDTQLKDIRVDTEKQLERMRHTVDEKLHHSLERRLGESFKQVQHLLKQVHEDMGEVRSLAVGVGDLQKVLSNVKTRGIKGEYQLGMLLEQILTPEQYAHNVEPVIGSGERVEYAIKLPGKQTDTVVWLPIDAKFPLDAYHRVIEAYDTTDTTLVAQAHKNLRIALEKAAKDIHEKYIHPPFTTEFAILFLPVEGLFAEVLRTPDIFDLLQRKYHITLAGPTTLAALLNSLQMGFRTLAIEKRSSEVWRVLAQVKEEFGKFAGMLDKVQKQLTTASNSLSELQTTRTNALNRKLRIVSQNALPE